MAWGFLSEHSAEFAVVVDAHRIASLFGEQLTPLYFWKTREGTHHARNSAGPATLVRAASVFARRPKTVSGVDSSVVVKLNDRLFDVATAFGEFGVPVLAACPLVPNLLAYRPDSPCAWFRVPPCEPLVDVEIRVTLDGGVVSQSGGSTALEILTDEDVRDAVFREPTAMPFEELQVVLDTCRRGRELTIHPIYGGVYRPITFVAAGDD